MKISKDSWHYKLISLASDKYSPHSRSLCTYFWQVVWSILKIIGITVLSLATLAFFLLLLTYPVAQFYRAETDIAAATISIILWGIVLLFVRDVLTDHLPADSILKKDISQNRRVKSKSLIS